MIRKLLTALRPRYVLSSFTTEPGVSVYYAGRAVTGEPRYADEAQAVRFTSRDDAAEMRTRIGDPNLKIERVR